jgi:hypothetical protein
MAIDPKKLIPVEGFLLDLPKAPQSAYVDRKNGVCVQVWENRTPACNGTPWEGTLCVCIIHTCAKTFNQVEKRGYAKPITWDDMQAIKDHFWPERIAIEVFPPRDKIVDVADMRWMWVLPKGAMLPFNLQSVPRVLES